jgi:hypothetical protein
MEKTFRGSLVRFPSHSPLPWSRLVVNEHTLQLVPRIGDTVEFNRARVRAIEVERYRGPFVFRTLFWVVTSNRHHHAFVPVRSKRLIETLQATGWPLMGAV